MVTDRHSDSDETDRFLVSMHLSARADRLLGEGGFGRDDSGNGYDKPDEESIGKMSEEMSDAY